MVDRRGRYSNTKPTICSSCGQCCSISSKVKPVFLQFLIVWSPLQLTQVPKTPDQAVFVLTTTTTDGQTDYITPCCACARGVISGYILDLRIILPDVSNSSNSLCHVRPRRHCNVANILSQFTVLVNKKYIINKCTISRLGP